MRTTLFLALASLTTACAVDTSSTQSEVNVNTKGEVISKEDIKLVQKATQDYRKVANAVADGYVEFSPECIVEEEDGESHAIGVMYDLIEAIDDVIEPERPETLLYEPQLDGSLELVGVEYWVPLGDGWPADGPAPTVFGVPFNLEEEMGIWGLHVWAWRENPEGITHEENENVHCP